MGSWGVCVCVCVLGAACPLDNNLIFKSGEAIKSPLLLHGAIGDLKPNESPTEYINLL